MAILHSHYDPQRVCLNPFPQFTLANWLFLDVCILSTHAKAPWGQPDTPVPVHVTFVDWIPGICSLLGFLVINLIDKDRIRREDGFGDSRAMWRARLFLFLGFAFMAGDLAGSITVLVLKYVIPDHAAQFKYYGYANVSQNVLYILVGTQHHIDLLMLAVVVLWMVQNSSNKYEYNLTL
ncbi:hypothetical protein B0H17DRAFT_1160425 [Mycena rosella]|uniref:Uncharacterized protein n=1 Tax=Mycena rosella TaxID=1033263 RepID=A0AAD7GGE7_MYCRO|nr:hypothetical protein B0H17DRAFT_1160425 [Mycena rosella]